jgi:hypothetical protein
MAREPSYPEDAPVGTPDTAGETGAAPASAAPESAVPGKSGGDSRRTKQIVAGAAIGIGSAALVAALLYANRSKKNERGGGGA